MNDKHCKKRFKARITICILISGICLLTSCNSPFSKKYEINKIEIATGGCLRGCPVVGEIIDSSLCLKFYGGYEAKLQGGYEGKVTQGFWDTLNSKLKRINLKALDSSEPGLPLDGEPAEVIFYSGNHKRHIFKSIYKDPDSVYHLLIWILNSYKRLE